MILKREDSLTYKLAIAKGFEVGERTEEEYSAEFNDCPHKAFLEETAVSAGKI